MDALAKKIIKIMLQGLKKKGIKLNVFLDYCNEILGGFAPKKLIEKGCDPAKCGYLESTIKQIK